MGDVVSTLRFHPYGQTAQRTGVKPVYGFAGGEIEEEEELGLIQFGARWYAPEIGRWVSADPLFLGTPNRSMSEPLESSLYIYCKNNPVFNVDPSGLDDEESWIPTQEDVEEGMKEIAAETKQVIEQAWEKAKEKLKDYDGKVGVEVRMPLIKNDRMELVLSGKASFKVNEDTGELEIKGKLSITGVAKLPKIKKLANAQPRVNLNVGLTWDKLQEEPSNVSSTLSGGFRFATEFDPICLPVEGKAFVEGVLYGNLTFPRDSKYAVGSWGLKLKGAGEVGLDAPLVKKVPILKKINDVRVRGTDEVSWEFDRDSHFMENPYYSPGGSQNQAEPDVEID